MSEPLHDPFARHDHTVCVARALEAADAQAAASGLKLTPMRRRVLEILLEEHKALGAYDVLSRLGAEGNAPQPPSVYRALDALAQAGLVHRIEGLNAFVACHAPDRQHAPAFLVCRACRTVAESQVAPDEALLKGDAEAMGFRIETTVREIIGLCPDCARDAS